MESTGLIIHSNHTGPLSFIHLNAETPRLLPFFDFVFTNGVYNVEIVCGSNFLTRGLGNSFHDAEHAAGKVFEQF